MNLITISIGIIIAITFDKKNVKCELLVNWNNKLEKERSKQHCQVGHGRCGLI